jgi:hypothetical protein
MAKKNLEKTIKINGLFMDSYILLVKKKIKMKNKIKKFIIFF